MNENEIAKIVVDVTTVEELPHDLTPQEERFLLGDAVGDEAEHALQRLVDRAAAAPNGVFVTCDVPDDASAEAELR